MRKFLDDNGEELSQALFVDFELIGIGERLAYLRSEGVVRKKYISPEVERLMQDLRGEIPLYPIEGIGSGVFTEMGTVWERGLKGVCLMALPETSRLLPEWHRLTDIPDRLELEALERVHTITWDLLQRLDRTGRIQV
jgi:hypothetical protein